MPSRACLRYALTRASSASGRARSGQELPRAVVDEPVDLPAGVALDEQGLPVLAGRPGPAVPVVRGGLAAEHPAAVVQGAVRRFGEPVGEVIRPAPGTAPVSACGLRPQRRQDRAEAVGAVEVHAAAVRGHRGEQQRVGSLGEQHPAFRGAHAECGRRPSVDVQEESRPGAVGAGQRGAAGPDRRGRHGVSVPRTGGGSAPPTPRGAARGARCRSGGPGAGRRSGVRPPGRSPRRPGRRARRCCRCG